MSTREAIPWEMIVVVALICLSLLGLGLVLPRNLVIFLAGAGAVALLYFSGVVYLLTRPAWIPPRVKKFVIVLGLLFPLVVVGNMLGTYQSLLTPTSVAFALGLLFVFLYYWLVVPLALYQTYRRESWVPDPDAWPSIAVVLPAYNEAGYVGDCIDSVLAARYPGPRELIVVDDGSTDGTHEEARAHAPDDATVLRTENHGKHAALNTALEHTDAEYIVCVDADSELHPDALVELIRRFFRYDDAGAVAGNVKVVNRDSLITKLQALEYVMGINTFRRAFDLVGTVIVVPGALGAFRREVVAEVGGYSADTVTEDFDLTIEVLKRGYSVRASTGIVYTEAPDTWRDLYLQRRRWFQGNLQTISKHRGVFFDHAYGLLHRVALPYVFLSMSVLPLLGIAVLGLILASLVTGGTGVLLQLAAFFVLLQFYLAILAIRIEDEDLSLAVLAPFTLFGYKQFLDVVLLRSVYAMRSDDEETWLRPTRIKQRLAAGVSNEQASKPPRDSAPPSGSTGEANERK